MKIKRKAKPDKDYARWRDSLRIDRENLDENMVQQPFLYLEISEAVLIAKDAADAAKQKLERVDADIADEARKAAEANKLRITVTEVGDHVIRHPAHLKAFNTWSGYKAAADHLVALRESFDQRAKMLKELGALFVSGYFDRVTVKGSERAVSQANANHAKKKWREQRGKDHD